MITKNELQDAFRESFNLQEGNRKHKQSLYGKDSFNLSDDTSKSNSLVDTVTVDDDVDDTVTKDDVADILAELLLPGKYTLGSASYRDEIKYWKPEFNKYGIYYLNTRKNIYYSYYKYMFDNGYLDNYKNYDMSKPKEILTSMRNVGSDEFSTDSAYFPLDPVSMFINVNCNQILGRTYSGALVVMSACMPDDGGLMRTYTAQSFFFTPSRCIKLIKDFVYNKIGVPYYTSSEAQFYKDVYGVNLT